MTASFLTAIILVVTTFVVISRNVHAKSHPRHWTPDSYPNPQKDTLGCGRNVTSWICDPDQVIPADVANAVDVLIARVASGAKPFGQAPCGKSGLEGFRIAAALMYRMERSQDAAAMALHFANRLQDAWAVGDPACDNGIIIVLSVFDQQMVITTGAAVATLLPPGALPAILQDARVECNQTRYGVALEHAVQRVGLALADVLKPHDDPSGGGGGGGGGGGEHAHSSWHWGLIIEEVLIAASCVSAAFGAMYHNYRRHARRKQQFKDCRSALEAIRSDNLAAIRSLGENDIIHPRCLICRAHLDGPYTTRGSHAALCEQESVGAGSDPDGGSLSDIESRCEECGPEEDSEAALRRPLNPRAAAAVAAAPADPSTCWRPGVMFPCNHAFCEPCIASRLHRQLSICPLCELGATKEAAEGASVGNATPGSAFTASNTNTIIAAGAAGAGAAADLNNGATTTATTATGGGGNGGGSVQVLLSTLRGRWEARCCGCPPALGPAGTEAQYPVLLFRLRQLKREYPLLLSTDAVRIWELDLRAGRDLDAHQLRAFRRSDPTHSREGGRGGLLVGSWSILRDAMSQLRGLRFWRRQR